MVEGGSERLGQLEPLELKSTAAFEAAVVAKGPEEQKERLQEAQSLAGQSALANAYRFLQQVVGLIAITLPFVLILGHLIFDGDGLEGSISSYYYTNVGNYFVGALFALGVFFLSYNHKPLPGYEWDNRLGNVAGLLAVGVALFPTASDAERASGEVRLVSGLHIAFAASLFVLLAVFSFFFFTKSDPEVKETKRKLLRNRFYRACGVTIAVAVVVAGINMLVEFPDGWYVFLWAEIVAVVTFGASWLVKGGFCGIMADR